MSVIELLTCSDAELLASWSPWYLSDRDPRWIRRNALVVLGNVGHAVVEMATDSEVQKVLSEYQTHDDPILREHAQWAAQRLGLHRVHV